jgi:hypothetical protein
MKLRGASSYPEGHTGGRFVIGWFRCTSEPASAAGFLRIMTDFAFYTPDWRVCGSHRFYVRDDVLFWECHGPTNLQDVVVLLDLRKALQRQYGQAFLLVDAQDHGGVPAESRRYAATFSPDRPGSGVVVVFGAGPLIRTAVFLISSAAKLLQRNHSTAVFFAASAAESWAIIAEQRLVQGSGQSSG